MPTQSSEMWEWASDSERMSECQFSAAILKVCCKNGEQNGRKWERERERKWERGRGREIVAKINNYISIMRTYFPTTKLFEMAMPMVLCNVGNIKIAVMKLRRAQMHRRKMLPDLLYVLAHFRTFLYIVLWRDLCVLFSSLLLRCLHCTEFVEEHFH